MTADENMIHRVIADALLAAQLPPGEALREVQLAEIFGVSRERIRKVLQRLGHERLLDLIPNRGAFVAAPSLDQARTIYDARRILEGGIVAHLAAHLSGPDRAALDDHLAQERRAAAAGDRAGSIRLSGEFHLKLAQATGNEHVTSQMAELVSRTSMLVALFEPSASSFCACDEHHAVFAAMIGGDEAGAVRAMRSHLSLIETRLRPRATTPSLDWVEVLQRGWLTRQKQARVTARKGRR